MGRSSRKGNRQKCFENTKVMNDKHSIINLNRELFHDWWRFGARYKPARQKHVPNYLRGIHVGIDLLIQTIINVFERLMPKCGSICCCILLFHFYVYGFVPCAVALSTRAKWTVRQKRCIWSKKRLIYLNSRLIMGKWLRGKDLNRKRVKVARQFKIESLHNEQCVTD